MALSLAHAEELADLMTGLGVEVEVRPGYSGRGMYGETTVAFVADDPFRALLALGFVAAQMADEDGDVFASFRDLPHRVDSMGLGSVIY